MANNQFFLYGANGYTGKLITELANHYGLNPILAGRNAAAIEALAAEYQLPFRIFDLTDKSKLISVLQEVPLVLHAAGPFQHTAKTMIEACLDTNTHYLDITGEIPVFEMAKTFDASAKEKNIMIMPGTGFDVVPTDCLALFLKNKMPDAHQLKLAFATLGGGLSHGTALTMIESLGGSGAVRENGKIIPRPLGEKGMWVTFGDKRLFVMSIPWGDVSTAYHTTGIANIETYTGIKPAVYKLLKLQRTFNWLLRTNFVKTLAKNQISKRAPGPDAELRKQSRSLVWGEVQNQSGQKLNAGLNCPDGYTLTAHSSLLITKKVLDGAFTPGYQTPASAYGENLVMQIPSVSRQ